ncbi:hypothetical protein VZT92_019936 [Zoarces viviparus]|uniref:Uncharacterized protein n=1 Tax=Zoarces viviparus TaxID=48416 RepID=A0AAW1EHH9_ZOAVI
MATLTRHRRAPVGQPRAGSDGRFLRPCGLASMAGRTHPRRKVPLTPAYLPVARFEARSRRPVCPRCPDTETVDPRSRLPWRAPPLNIGLTDGFLRRHSYSNPTRINPHPDARLAHMSAPSGGLARRRITHLPAHATGPELRTRR